METKIKRKGFPTPASYQIIATLVDKLLEKGYSEKDCGKFLGGNMYRVMKQVGVELLSTYLFGNI